MKKEESGKVLNHQMNFIEKISMIDEHILEIVYLSKINIEIEKVVKHIHTSNGTVQMKELQNISKLSQRQIERLFNAHIGISPKKLSGIVKFRRSLNLLKNSELTLVEIAVTAGYFDQSHFHKTFKSFMGVTPDFFSNHIFKNKSKSESLTVSL